MSCPFRRPFSSPLVPALPSGPLNRSRRSIKRVSLCTPSFSFSLESAQPRLAQTGQTPPSQLSNLRPHPLLPVLLDAHWHALLCNHALPYTHTSERFRVSPTASYDTQPPPSQTTLCSLVLTNDVGGSLFASVLFPPARHPETSKMSFLMRLELVSLG
ncbi:hypothetical protein AOQ84DRAFT_355153 [Glonium stellatum]|uniref:Uncharacterized protein n=1 Tax=Glonium stellatum TaxID=574774 RepID=A0A8E2JRV2_9PEZI|nr:hypothetical protein AOQ84DRAFT_355153 [Glonium stellatum]